jgi:maltooligosyltrehalose trehalohydrolase
MLFQGEEWGATTPFRYFTDHGDPELGARITEGRRREFASFGWAPEEVPDPQDPATFERSKLDWAEREKDEHQDIESWYRLLLALRRRRPELTDPRWEQTETQVDEDGEGRWLLVRRGRIGVATNLGADATEIAVPEPARVLAASDRSVALTGGWLQLGPDTTAVFETGPEVEG